MEDIIKEHNKKSKIKIVKDSEENYFFEMEPVTRISLGELSMMFAQVAQALYLVIPENQKKLEKESEEYKDIFDIPRLKLDRELLQFYMERHRSPYYSIDRQSHYSCQIESLLSEDIDETIELLEDCTEEDIECISEEIANVCYDFYREAKENYFRLINVLKQLSKEQPKKKELKSLIHSILETIRDAKEEEIFETFAKKMSDKAISLNIKMRKDMDFPEDIQKCLYECFTSIEYFSQPPRVKITTDDVEELAKFFSTVKEKFNMEITLSTSSIVIGNHKPKLWL